MVAKVLVLAELRQRMQKLARSRATEVVAHGEGREPGVLAFPLERVSLPKVADRPGLTDGAGSQVWQAWRGRILVLLKMSAASREAGETPCQRGKPTDDLAPIQPIDCPLKCICAAEGPMWQCGRAPCGSS